MWVWIRRACVACMLYLAVSCAAYKLGHPDMTETRLFLDIPKALVWSW